jgi:recombination protein RecR
MSSIEKLKELFRRFPGIGPKQAERFALFVLKKEQDFVDQLLNTIKTGRLQSRICKKCFSLFEINKEGTNEECKICSDKNRNVNTLMVVAKEQDLESIEKSNAFDGLYFILGDFVPILDKDPEKRVRIKDLKNRLAKDSIKEIILAFGTNVLAENTESYVKQNISKIALQKSIKITTLGRGLSTGTEIEYSDKETIKNSLENRKAVKLTQE